jgi:hypothetical protein
VNKALELLLSSVYPGALAPAHQADLDRSGLTPATIAQHKIRSVPPGMISHLLGFSTPDAVTSAYVIPFPDPRGGWMDHVRLKVVPSYKDGHGRTVKYLGPKGASPRLFFCLATLDAACVATERLWLVEGAKKALAVAQLGLAAVGFEGIEGWHRGRAVTTLLADFDLIPLAGRLIELVPDGDVETNSAVRGGAARLADALRARGTRPRLVRLPTATRPAA